MFENIALAMVSLRANKMRALLTMLGIIIGIASVIAIVTLGDSLVSTINGSMQNLGVNNVIVALQMKNSTSGVGAVRMRSGVSDDDLISRTMITALVESFPDSVGHVAYSANIGSGKVTLNKKSANVSLLGVSPGYQTASQVTMNQGRFVTDKDSEAGRKVAVISDYLANRIFGMSDPMGQVITVIAGQHTGVYTVVGVYTYEQNAMNFTMNNSSDISTNIYIPLSTAQKVTGTKGFASVTLVTAPGVDAIQFASDAARFVNRYYAKNENFQVNAYSMESMVSTVTDMMSTIQTAIAAIAAISLLVGGIGVMNIMLVSITERTREIGTRKAIGATNGEIRIQFIIEAVIICLIGGIIGIAAGVGMGSVGASILGVSASPSLSTMAIAAGFCMMIGVFFGYYPANKAAKLDPIEALRYE